MQTPRASWVPKVRWLVLATSILIVGGLWLRWWTARGTIREIHRLGGRYSAATSAGIRGAFEVILAVDGTVDEIKFEKTDVPDEFNMTDEGLNHLHGSKMLQVVNVTGTKVTAEGVAALQRSSGCRVIGP